MLRVEKAASMMGLIGSLVRKLLGKVALLA